MTNSPTPKPLGRKERAFFEHLFNPSIPTTDLDTASRLLKRVKEGEITQLPDNLELHHIRGAIADLLDWMGNSEIDEDKRGQATWVRKWINLISLARSEGILNEEKLREKWLSYGEGKIEGSYESLLGLVRKKVNHLTKEVDGEKIRRGAKREVKTYSVAEMAKAMKERIQQEWQTKEDPKEAFDQFIALSLTHLNLTMDDIQEDWKSRGEEAKIGIKAMLRLLSEGVNSRSIFIALGESSSKEKRAELIGRKAMKIFQSEKKDEKKDDFLNEIKNAIEKDCKSGYEIEPSKVIEIALRLALKLNGVEDENEIETLKKMIKKRGYSINIQDHENYKKARTAIKNLAQLLSTSNGFVTGALMEKENYPYRVAALIVKKLKLNITIKRN